MMKHSLTKLQAGSLAAGISCILLLATRWVLSPEASPAGPQVPMVEHQAEEIPHTSRLELNRSEMNQRPDEQASTQTQKQIAMSWKTLTQAPPQAEAPQPEQVLPAETMPPTPAPTSKPKPRIPAPSYAAEPSQEELAADPFAQEFVEITPDPNPPPTTGFNVFATQQASASPPAAQPLCRAKLKAAKVQSGQLLTLTLTEDLPAYQLKAGTRLNGTCTLTPHRVLISIRQIPAQGRIQRVKFQCLDPTDGKLGLNLSPTPVPENPPNGKIAHLLEKGAEHIPRANQALQTGKEIQQTLDELQAPGQALEVLIPEGMPVLIRLN